MIVLVGGGSRSGKTRFALDLARNAGPGRLAYLATAELLDGEMRERAANHRAERAELGFETVEEPRAVAEWIEARGADYAAVVIDCLTLWTSNWMLSGIGEVQPLARRLATAAAQCPARVVCVTNEVGCGIVPDNELARRFRDEAGWVNQTIASSATEVYWMVFGCPLKVKG